MNEEPRNTPDTRTPDETGSETPQLSPDQRELAARLIARAERIADDYDAGLPHVGATTSDAREAEEQVQHIHARLLAVLNGTGEPPG